MADARPIEFARPTGWYAKTPDDIPGLSPVKTKTEPSPTSRVSVRCPKCSSKVWLLDGAQEVIWGCGEVVKA
jgi:hypothetical protein